MKILFLAFLTTLFHIGTKTTLDLHRFFNAAMLKFPARWSRIKVAAAAALASMVMTLTASAQSPSPYTPHTVPSSLFTSVNTLVTNATTNQQKLRAQSLLWALNEANYEFTTGTQTFNGGTISTDRTVSFQAGNTTVVQAPSGVTTSSPIYDLIYSPLGIGDGLVADVQTNLTNNTQIGSPNTATNPLGYNLFPAIPNYPTGTGGQPVNVLASGAMTQLASQITSGNVGIYNEVPQQAFGYPTNSQYGNPSLVPLMFTPMEGEYDSTFLNTNGSADFSSAPALAQQYLLLIARYPDLILPSVQKRWEASIYQMAVQYYNYVASSSDPSLATPTPDRPFLLGDPARAYPNQDFRDAEAMYYAGIIFTNGPNHANYSPNIGANFKAAIYAYFHNIALSPAVLFGDGAFTYVYGSNEVSDYQGSETGPTSNLMLIMQPLTGAADVAARNDMASALEGSRLFYPTEFPTQLGFTVIDSEYPAWKQGFDSGSDYEATGLIYELNPMLSNSSDPQLWRVYDETGFAHPDGFDLYSSACLDTSIDPFAGSKTAATATDPDQYFFYSQNFEGPHARFGLWMMNGSARMNRNDNRGTASQVGFNYLGGSGQPGVELSSASSIIFTDTAGDYVNTTTNDEQDSTIVQPGFATMSAISTLAPHSGVKQPFQTVQQWIYTPSRMVGQVLLVQNTSTNQTEYGVGGAIQFHGTSDFAAATGATPRLQYGQYGSSPYSYDMIVNMKENTFGNYADAILGSDRTAELIDQTTFTAKVYPPGVVGHYVVDFHPATGSDATSAKSLTTGLTGVYALEVKEGSQMYRLIHNTTSSTVTYTGTLASSDWGTGAVDVHFAYTPQVDGSSSATPARATVPAVPGETYRDGWVSPTGDDSYSSTLPSKIGIASGSITYTIPANSHILLLSDPNNLPAPFFNQDVGDVAYTGTSSYSNGTFTLTGSGADIWNAVDGFQYDYTSLNGDGAIIAQLATQTSTTNKSGVMIRETLSDNSSYADMVLQSSQAKFEFRNGAGTNAQSAATPVAQTSPVWLKLVRAGNSLTAFYSATNGNWTELGGAETVSMASSLSIGLAQSNHSNTGTGTATFNNVSILPSGSWAASDIGAVTAAGASGFNNGVVTMNAEGADIYGGADAFRYEYQALSGNGTITARVSGISNSNAAAKAGVMIRETLAAGATNAFMLLSAGNGVNSQWRSSTNGSTSQGTGVSGKSAPYWVRVSRSGNTFTEYYSPDGSNWTTQSTQTITMATSCYIGLALTSHSTSTPCTATFDNITIN